MRISIKSPPVPLPGARSPAGRPGHRRPPHACCPPLRALSLRAGYRLGRRGRGMKLRAALNSFIVGDLRQLVALRWPRPRQAPARNS